MSSRAKKFPTLKDWRLDKRYTLQQAADALGIALVTYYNIERGHHVPRRELMKRLIEQTGVPADVLALVA